MSNKLQVILSCGVLILFGLMAMASWGSTNTEVKVGECKPKPGFTGEFLVEIASRHQDGTILANVAGTLFLTHQIIQDTATCQHAVVSIEQVPFVTDAAGRFHHWTASFTHTNAGDLWRAEVNVPAVAGRHRGFRRVQAAKYSVIYLSFELTEMQAL